MSPVFKVPSHISVLQQNASKSILSMDTSGWSLFEIRMGPFDRMAPFEGEDWVHLKVKVKLTSFEQKKSDSLKKKNVKHCS